MAGVRCACRAPSTRRRHNPGMWKRMKVAVIGGAGKIGQQLVRELLGPPDGPPAHEVTVFDRVAGPPPPGVRYLIGDHGDLGQVIAAVAGADVLVHLAALVRGYPDPAIFHNNVTGT